ncbi:MAG TPA: polysaccharide deacetylase family protein [Rhodoblastus sp.]|nr:polysaccharide deacetylase family protein [Rhodoblastus sp.]
MRIFFATLLLAALAGAASAEPGKTACANPDALGTSRVIEVGAPGGLHVGLKTYPQTLALADKEVVLTFDDGPLPGLTGKALDALAKECVRATFFFIGRNAAASPEIVRRAAKEGHTIGHHSWSHPARTLRGLSPAAGIEDIRRGIEATQRAAGQGEWTSGRPAAPFFRFPGFADTPETLAWLDAQGIAVFGADLWASDWLPQTPEAQLELVMRRLAASHGGILLLHDIHAQTVAMLPALLRRLKHDGYRIVQIRPGADKPAVREAPAGWKSETGAFLDQAKPRPKRPAHARSRPQRAHNG